MAAMLDHALPVVCTVRVVYAYMAREEGDLTLNKGDIIRVHDNDGGWWKGSLLPDYIYGSFPSNFVEILHENNTQESTLTSPRTQSRQRQHSRQSSVDSSKFTKRKPVNTQLAKHNAPSSTSLPYRGSTNCSSVSLSAAAPSRNPQAIIGDMTDLEQPIKPQPHRQHSQKFADNRRNSQDSERSTMSRLSQLSSHFSQILTVSSGRRQSTKSEGAAPGDDGAEKQSRAKTNASQAVSLPGAYPFAPSESTVEAARVTNEAVYNPSYADQNRHPGNRKSNLLNPSGPDGTLTTSHGGTGRHLTNRFSMPNLAGDALTQQQHQSLQPSQEQRDPRHAGMSGSSVCLAPGQMYLQDAVGHGPRGATGTQSAYHLPRGNMSGHSLGGYETGSQSTMQGSYHGQRRPEEKQQHHQHGMMPRSSTEYYSQQFVSHGVTHPMQQASYGHVHDASQQFAQQQQQQQGYRHSIANFGTQPLDQQLHSPQGHYPIQHSQLSLENLAKHNRSQSALDPPKSHSSHGAAHGRSVSQVNLKPQGSAVFNPYDHQQQQQQQLEQHQLHQLHLQQQQQQQQQQRAYSASMHRLSMGPLRTPSPSIVIPQPKGRPHSAFANYAAGPMASNENSPTSAGTSTTFSTPQTPNTVQSKRAGTPTSAGTHMSEASTSSARDQRRKSETARLPPSASMTASNFSARKFSVDSRTLLTTGSTSASTAAISSATARASIGGHENGLSEDSLDGADNLGTYTAKKPKTTLIRAFKQIINPKKVAQKDALKNKNEHFAWIEMQKSLKRVPSPEPGQERSHFAVTTSTTSAAAAALASGDVAVEDFLQQSQGDQDPFSILRRSHVMRDNPAAVSTPVAGGILDFGPNAFVQVDKVARNVNQRGPHMTPQLLSQKYLTRPYSKAPLSKLRVLFVWVSENIRLEGGTTRDVSGGRYKLGPAGEHPSTSLTAAVTALGNESPTIRSGACTPPASVFMAGVEEYTRGFLQEGTPELAQEVLTSRTSKTGEGFANLFAEMALAAGIEDVGVVKGYVKGPMDVFSKDVPASNHAWNVVRIDGTYRFIDCCLASPLHPAHYPNRPQTASSFYFLTQPMDLVLTHHPVFLTYQYITPSIPPQIFLQLPFVRPAYFDFGLSLPDFKTRTRLDVMDHEPVEIVVRIDGNGGIGGAGGAGGVLGQCLGKGCGEGVELRAEIEVMTSEGKIIRKRGLAQVMIWNPYQQQLQQPQSVMQQQQGPASSSLSVGGPTSSAVTVASIAAASNRLPQSHHCTGIRIAKIKAVLPNETVVGPGGVRKGIVHIYAGRKVENAPSDATPYSLALSLPVRHTGAMPKTPFSFVLPHFSPYEFYVKTPQSEFLYYPHTYKFCIVSLAAQAQAVVASATAMALAENNEAGISSCGTVVGSPLVGSGGGASTRHVKALTNGGHATAGSTTSMTPMYRPQPNAQTLRSHYGGVASASASLQTLAGPGSGSVSLPQSGTTTSFGTIRGGGGGKGGGGLKHSPYLHQHHPYQMNSSTSMASTSSMSVNGGVHSSSNINGGSNAGYCHGMSIPRPERLVLRTQTNRLYKLMYDPVRQCHEAQVEVKERGIWECVRMDDGGKSRVGREGTGGVVIASWKCV
ncbi:cytokinesis protein 3 [Mortierella alpina]|nr:cytokinesis protein 3 [Mortierella alpina]